MVYLVIELHKTECVRPKERDLIKVGIQAESYDEAAEFMQILLNLEDYRIK